MIFLESITAIRETFSKRVSEWSNAGITFVLGWLFLLNTGMFEANPEIWKRLAIFATQTTWGWSCLTIGTIRLVALVVNGAYVRSPAVRAVCAFITSFLWYQLAVSLIPNAAIGAAVFPILTLADIYNTIRAGGEAGSAEVEHKHGGHIGPRI